MKGQELLVAVFLVFIVQASAVPFRIYHVTDVHGWVFGHPHNSTLNADFGDFCSLIEHTLNLTQSNGENFFMFDSGDLIEGTGLSDATPIHGEYIFEIVKKVPGYSALTMGNHDIEYDSTVTLMENSFIPHWNGSYLTANSLFKSNSSYLGAPYTVVRNANGVNVLVLGYLFNFTLFAEMTDVQDVSLSLLEPYFADAMMETDIDLYVVIAHIAPQTPPELEQIYQAIRSFKPNSPLVILSGHSHVRYFQWFDSNAFTMESGKYFETLGVIEFDLENGNFNNFNYEFYDTSLDNFYELSETDPSNFLTARGAALKKEISYYFNLLQLNYTYGCSPDTFDAFVNIAEPLSLYNLFLNKIIPATLFNNSVANTQFFMCNSQTLRANLWAGRVTKNDVLSVLPFGDIYYYFPAVLGSQIQRVVTYLGTSGKLYARHIGDELPQYEHSTMDLTPTQSYALVCSEYDSIAIGTALKELFPSYTFTRQLYPTTMKSTEVLSSFIEQNWPCSSEF